MGTRFEAIDVHAPRSPGPSPALGRSSGDATPGTIVDDHEAARPAPKASPASTATRPRRTGARRSATAHPLTLPSSEEQDFLLTELAALVRARGAHALVEATILEPSPLSFPDAWTADLEGATRVVRRLMDHAGLGGLAIDLRPFGDGELPDGSLLGWFAGIDDATCRFGVHVLEIRDAERLAGVMAHEVAHAYRAHHGLVNADPALEERLTDLTSVYLGFGVLTTNLTEVNRRDEDAWYIELTTRCSGYLSLEEMSFLLAVQAVARELDDDDLALVAKLLASSQSKCFRDAVDALASKPRKLRARLGVVPGASPTKLARVSAAATRGAGRPFGRVAYRAVQRRVGLGVAVGVSVGVGLAAVVPAVAAPLVMLGAMAIGGELGHRVRSYTCSRCSAPLARDGERCPTCAGWLIANLWHPPHRFGAGENRGRRVFRVRGSRALSFAALGVVIGFVVALGLTRAGASGGVAFCGFLAPVFIGLIAGRAQRLDSCSAISCEAPLEPGLWECPRCLGEIAGEIRKRSERLAAEEATRPRPAAPLPAMWAAARACSSLPRATTPAGVRAGG